MDNEDKVQKLLDQGFTHDQIIEMVNNGKLKLNEKKELNVDTSALKNITSKGHEIIKTMSSKNKKRIVISLIAILAIVIGLLLSGILSSGNLGSNSNYGSGNAVKSVSDYFDLQVTDLGVSESDVNISGNIIKKNLTNLMITGIAKQNLTNISIFITGMLGDNNKNIIPYDHYYTDEPYITSSFGTSYCSIAGNSNNYTSGMPLEILQQYVSEKPVFIMFQVTKGGTYTSSRTILEHSKIKI